MNKERKIVIKPHWLKVLNMHADWLISKGYTEKLLGTREPDGLLLDRIKESIRQAVFSTFWEYNLEKFTVETYGQFANGKDKVVFKLNYVLDPAGQRLSLTSLTAALDDVSMDYPIERNTPHQLPPATSVYRQLLTLSNKTLLERIRNATSQPEPKNKKLKKI